MFGEGIIMMLLSTLRLRRDNFDIEILDIGIENLEKLIQKLIPQKLNL